MTGKVDRVFADKGFGFIVADGKRYFFHRTAVRNGRFEDLEKGTDVNIEDCGEREKGLYTERVFVE